MDTCVQINGMPNLNNGAWQGVQGLTHVPTQQDCVAVIPPLPFFTDPPDKFDMETRLDDLWFARLELMFSCSLCITGQIDRGLSNPEAISVDLALISTFEDLPTPPPTVLGKEGCRIVYAAKGTPCLYVIPLSHCACRVPLMPCFLRGNSKPTILWEIVPAQQMAVAFRKG